VPVNWSAYEDIAEFFTNDVKEIDGVKVYGHMDYGKKDPSLGWRFTDAWLSMAGNGDKGIPNGKPVDEWGIRMEGCRPVGSSVERGGDTNGPAAVYSIAKYLDWMKKYAPPQAQGMTFSESGPVPAQGNDRPADLLVHRLHRRHGEARPAGRERRRHAEVAHGAVAARLVLEGGHEARLPGRRLLDAAEVDPADRRKAAWLYLQFIVSKTVSLKKSHVGLTFIRESDIWDKSSPSARRSSAA
jgi:glycerol transport system substrate-binding protein